MRPSLRLLTILLFACALALRGWVPTGWMPTPGAQDFSIMPCPAAESALAMNMGHGSAHHDRSGFGSDCFSPLLAGAALPDPPSAIAAPSPVPPVEQTPSALVAFTGGPAAAPPHSTGPPAIA
jgi:hypothetical protein